MRMNPEGRVDEIVFLGQTNSAIDVLRSVTVADRDDGLHSGLTRPSNHVLAIGVESLAIEMCV
jgi:hypothetical protein